MHLVGLYIIFLQCWIVTLSQNRCKKESSSIMSQQLPETREIHRCYVCSAEIKLGHKVWVNLCEAVECRNGNAKKCIQRGASFRFPLTVLPDYTTIGMKHYEAHHTVLCHSDNIVLLYTGDAVLVLYGVTRFSFI